MNLTELFVLLTSEDKKPVYTGNFSVDSSVLVQVRDVNVKISSSSCPVPCEKNRAFVSKSTFINLHLGQITGKFPVKIPSS